MRTRRSAKRRFKEGWRTLYEGSKRGELSRVARALLAFQFCERDPETGGPSDDARLGALWTADYQLHHRAFMRGFSGGEE